ncbi:MAG: porin family protein [Hyphomicrobiales bacterium]|nr:porin family protein [Hyphomicrobiales bacterium]
MGNLKKVSTSLTSIMASALFAAAISSSVSFAADLPPIVEIPPEVVPQSYSGWYLRGDIGYARASVDGVTYFQGSTQSGEFEQHDIDNGLLIGGGLGYQINDWFRVDLTSNYHARVDFKGSSAQNVACSAGGGGICSYSDDGGLQITTLMANAYFDLGTYQGLTPYVGAALGGAYLHWDDLENVEYHVSGTVPGTTASDTHGMRSGWRFAYGLHAGASYDISSNMKIDAGYTWTRISEGEMFGFGSTSGLSGTQGYHEQMNVHAFKVGLRYSFN